MVGKHVLLIVLSSGIEIVPGSQLREFTNLVVQGVHKVLHTFKILISQKPHMVETLDFRQ